MSETLDVVVVGAGLSGIGAACCLAKRCPWASVAVLEARGTLGGTWDLFRYPGVRSDSDMFTLGYSFRPWDRDESIASGAAIRDYIADSAAEHGIDGLIRYHHQVVKADWSSEKALWRLRVKLTPGQEISYADKGAGGQGGNDQGAGGQGGNDQGAGGQGAGGQGAGGQGGNGQGGNGQGACEEQEIYCRFVISCTGYYRYDRGYMPSFPGIESFGGMVVHPQSWPETLDCSSKRVVVIGSGATAMTLVPALARQGAQVTMLQRSPTYVASLPTYDPLAAALDRMLPQGISRRAIRWMKALTMEMSYRFMRSRPGAARRLLRHHVASQLPEGYDIDTHFNPSYAPWDQRLCVVPDGDLFEALRSGTASVVTDRIDTFTDTGIRLASGDHLEADVVVSATGLELIFLGGIEIEVDGHEVKPSERLLYRGMMLEGVPNLAIALGYTNASWTLRCDLTFDYVTRLLDHMRKRSLRQVTPVNHDPSMPRAPLLALRSGYVMRAAGKIPMQGAEHPWHVRQSYLRDYLSSKVSHIDDPALVFGAPGAMEVDRESSEVRCSATSIQA